MMRIIPTYVVTFDDRTFRVPETDLDGFLHVLIFNGTDEFHVKTEDGWNIRSGEPPAELLLDADGRTA